MHGRYLDAHTSSSIPRGPAYLSTSTFPFPRETDFFYEGRFTSSLHDQSGSRINLPRARGGDNGFTWVVVDTIQDRFATDFSGTIQLVRNTEAAKCEVDDSHGERGQSMLGARLSLVSILIFLILLIRYIYIISNKKIMSNGASFSNQWKNESILSGCSESNFTRVSLEFVQPTSL